jgi:uncharacterized protein YkwD
MKREMVTSMCIAGLLLASTATSSLASPAAGKQTDRPALAGGIVSALNDIRVRHGLVRLTLDRELSLAAQRHTSEMIADGYFSHSSFDDSAFWKRLTAYTRLAKQGSGVGENLVWTSGVTDASAALSLWMSSAEHRANILSPRWRQIGVSAIFANAAPGIFGGSPITVITTDFGFRD